MARKFNLNSRTITAPLAAFCMASILFVYARTSIQAAKRNAQKHREADGGQISWRNESLRRHGVLEPPEAQGPVSQLLLGGRPTGASAGAGAGAAAVKNAVMPVPATARAGSETGNETALGIGMTDEEERVRAVAAKRGWRDGR